VEFQESKRRGAVIVRGLIYCRARRIVAVALWMIVACSLVLFAQAATENPGMRVTRSLSAAHALPESTFQVTLELKADTDLNGVGLREHLPFGWVIHPVENDGAAFKRSEAEWVFNETIEAGSTHYITYELTVPAAGQLMTNPLPQCFTISGTYQTTVPSFETATEGESTIEIDSALPIGTAIAHLIPQQVAGTDIIDLRLSRWISEAQLERALELWQHDLPVPGTAGQRIDLATMNHLAAQFETCTRADDALPLSIDPELIAIRTLETFLPCDHVLLPEGCLDPGQAARLVSVHIAITPSFDAYGISLKEWLPSAWKATPIEQDGFRYRSSANEWIYPTKVRAGETIELTYQIEVIPTPYDSVEAGAGCCGQEMLLVGEASAALECSIAPVLGEDTVTVDSCIPVLLAISRWDVEEDRLDVKLSDSISLGQVQRAVQFWANNQPVPHTCGYTVGYHMLKSIVAYWLAGTPITLPLSQDAALPSCGDSSEDCESALCIEGWICQLAEMQDPADFVGLPEPPTVEVDGGPDRVLTCAQPSVTLSAVTSGGVEPFKYEWRDSHGQTVGTARTLTVRASGTYTLIAISCGGCLAIDTVTVTDDFAQPVVQASVDAVLTGYVTSVDITADFTGGTGPFAVVWTKSSGERISDRLTLTVSEPGVYAVTVTGANGCRDNASILVLQDIEPPSVQIDITPTIRVAAGPADAVLTCALPEIVLESQVSGGREPYILQWTSSQGAMLGSESLLDVETPGIYVLTATGANGISASTSVEVGQDIEPPSVTVASSGELTCAVTEIALSSAVTGGRAPFVYQWTNEDGSIVGSESGFRASEPGEYALSVTGSNGCSDSATIVVAQDITPPVIATAVDGVLTCSVSEVTASAVASGGRAPYAFTWLNSAGQEVGDNDSLPVSDPGVYTVIVIGGNGCSSAATIDVEQDIEPPVVTASVDGVLTCVVSSVNLHANVVGGRTPLIFEWTNEAGHVVGTAVGLTTSAPGIYTILVTGANGCTSSDRVIVAEDVESPSLSIAVEDTLTCAVTEVQLIAAVSGGRAPYSYAWTDAAGAVVGQSSTLSVSMPGTFTLIVTGANGCSASASATVDQDIEPPVVTAAATDELTCSVTEVTLISDVTAGSTPYVYAWTNEEGHILGSDSQLVVDSPGAYTLTVTGANGCEGSTSISVHQDIAPPCVTLCGTRTLTCNESTAFVNAEICGGRAPFTYQWIDDCGAVIATTKDVALSFAGIYTLTVTGANGCSSSNSVEVIDGINPPSVEAGPDRTLACAGDEIVLDATVSGGSCPYTYTWVNSCAEIVGNHEDLAVTLPGIYILTVQSADGCVAMDSVTVELP